MCLQTFKSCPTILSINVSASPWGPLGEWAPTTTGAVGAVFWLRFHRKQFTPGISPVFTIIFSFHGCWEHQRFIRRVSKAVPPHIRGPRSPRKRVKGKFVLRTEVKLWSLRVYNQDVCFCHSGVWEWAGAVEGRSLPHQKCSPGRKHKGFENYIHLFCREEMALTYVGVFSPLSCKKYIR